MGHRWLGCLDGWKVVCLEAQDLVCLALADCSDLMAIKILVQVQ